MDPHAQSLTVNLCSNLPGQVMVDQTNVYDPTMEFTSFKKALAGVCGPGL